MIKYSKTTVFNVDVQTVVNTVNCVGVMGAGLALECKLRFLEMYKDYKKLCKENRVKTGKPYVYKCDDDFMVMNFPTKNHWKYPSKIEWIEEGLDYFITNYERYEISSIAFPKLGSGRGKLDWKNVKPLMENYLKHLDIEVCICLDEEGKAAGIEKEMVDMLNQMDEEQWMSKLKIRKSISDNILKALPLHRFYQLQKVKGVGKQSYESIFKLFYIEAQKGDVVCTDNSKHPQIMTQQPLFA